MSSENAFRISGLPLEPFLPYFKMTDAELAEQGAVRRVVEERPGYPCRVSLIDANVGETVILLPYPHQPEGPYRSTGPIFVREAAEPARLEAGEVPELVSSRLMSLRAYDAENVMIFSDVVEGRNIREHVEKFLANKDVAYLHLHNAKPGCFSCRVDRA